MQFRRRLKDRLQVQKKAAHREQISKRQKRKKNKEKSKGKKKEEPSACASNAPVELYPFGGYKAAGDNEECRICGRTYKFYIDCNGCNSRVCKKCANCDSTAEWRLMKKCNWWICIACDQYLRMDND